MAQQATSTEWPGQSLSQLFGLEGKRALVAGGGQGIGRSCALMLARAGCAVAVTDLERGRAEAVAAEVEEFGRTGLPLVADVRNAQAAAGAVDATVDALGALDVCVNVIGLASWKPFLELDEATWDADMLGNLKHHYFVAQPAARQMAAQGDGGAITVIASVSGLFAAPNHAAYGAAKAGLVGLVKSLGEELAPYGVRANAVAPGSVRTPRIVAMQERGEAPVQQSALDQMAECDDIGTAVLFLSSEMARKITGQALVVDAGVTTKFPFDVG